MEKRNTETIDDLETLSEIIEYIPIGVLILDPEGRVLLMNRWQEKISRINREKIIGGLFHEQWSYLFDQGVMDGYWDLLKQGKPFDVSVHEVNPQFYDQKISAISRGVPLPKDKGFILLHEVSEEMKRDKKGLKRLKNQLAEAHNFLINVINSSPNIVITTDRANGIRSVNYTGEKQLGYSEDDLINQQVSLLFEKSISFTGFGDQLDEGIRKEIMCIRKDGTTFPARIQVRDVVTKTGKFQAKLILISDLTWEKRMEEKLALSQKLAIYSELMAGIAHQLNNPLVGVVNFSALLLEKTDKQSENRELAETIHSAALKCRNMLTYLIKSIREPQSMFNEVDISEIITAAILAAQQQEPGAAANCNVDIKLPETLSEVKGDHLQLLETFRNLMVNAFQAMSTGGTVEISARKDRVRGKILIRISDTGPGISKEQISKIFDPFYSTKKGKGTGLGLSFAFQIIRSHGGRIDCLPTENSGATFEIELPIINS